MSLVQAGQNHDRWNGRNKALQPPALVMSSEGIRALQYSALLCLALRGGSHPDGRTPLYFLNSAGACEGNMQSLKGCGAVQGLQR